MARFIQKDDYAMQVRQEIIRVLTTNDAEWYNSAALIRAENTAIAQIKNRIGKRYDMVTVFGSAIVEPNTFDPSFAPSFDEGLDTRDQWIVTITIDLALYHLYSKTGTKDVPEHRSNRYQDAIDWLKDVSRGDSEADLPKNIDQTSGEEYSDFRISSRTPENHKW